ncbi:MAG: AAA family ATPase, partial [Chloroflexi bacterium]|nr:AAA family ATPase [Chloroflexota bacterium]
MRIEGFHIQGFKNIADVKVKGLADINVFYGLNGVGKSNLFQGLALWQRLLTTPRTTPLEKFEEEFGSPFTPLKGENTIRLKVILTLERHDLPDQNTGTYNLALSSIASYFDSLDKIQIVSEVEIGITRINSKGVLQCQIKEKVQTGTEILFDIPQSALEALLSLRPCFHIIQASRRFQIEQRGKGNGSNSVSDHNLKQALFYAYLSSDLQQKARLAAIKRILAEPPFSLGELDVALDPATDWIDIGFVRPEGRLPIENLGTGSQQLLLVLGQIFLNDYPIIAIEEPEMNLSPQYQQYLLVALRELMQDPAVKLNQL